MLITTSAARDASAGVSKTSPVPSCSARFRVRFQRRRSNPCWCRRRAIAPPILPVPRIATFIRRLLFSLGLAGKLEPMRAAVIERYGEPPVLRDVPEPKADGASLVEVTAAPLNPVDISIA